MPQQNTNNMIKEIFKDIPGYEGIYQVSDLGRVKSFKGRFERILKPGVVTGGYMQVSLNKKPFRIHYLVIVTFLNRKPDKSINEVVNHKNFIRTDNRLENLEIITQRENANKKHLNSGSKYTGVCWVKSRNKWGANILINRHRRHLGYFTNEIDAHNAYQNRLKQL